MILKLAPLAVFQHIFFYLGLPLLLPLIPKKYRELKPVKLITENQIYLLLLHQDMGFFPGYESRKFLAELIAYKMPPGKNGKPQYNATFKEHFKVFKIKLVVTGSNLETGKSEYFSCDTTPNLAVADAVRISMGIPLAFKPVIIRKGTHFKDELPDWVDSVWVDGGLFNNIPIQAFDSESGENPKTLGLRLGVDEPLKIKTLTDFFPLQWPLLNGLTGTGESQISKSTNESHAITLDTTGLDLFNFKPDDKIRDVAIAKAYKCTMEYFTGSRQKKI